MANEFDSVRFDWLPSIDAQREYLASEEYMPDESLRYITRQAWRDYVDSLESADVTRRYYHFGPHVRRNHEAMMAVDDLQDAMLTILMRSSRGHDVETARNIIGRVSDTSVICQCEDSSHDDDMSGHHDYQNAYAQWRLEGDWMLCGYCYVSGHCPIYRD